LSARVAEVANRDNVPGVAVGVLLGDAEDYVSYGVTSVENPLPVNEATFFAIGSMTKTYTGTVIMMLAERGLLNLHAPVFRYLPDLTLQDEQVTANVTVLQLLNHTAGWAGDVFIDTGYGDDALARYVALLADVPQEFPPGRHVSYNNAALSVAGRVIEVVTGRPYETALQELLLDPLRLGEHHFFPWDVMIRRFALGHVLIGGELRVAPWYEARAWHPAGGGFASTACDQLRYARFHLGDGDGVLRRETLARMREPTTPAAELRRGNVYGVSWRLAHIGGVTVIGHGGSTAGHQTTLQLAPERGFAITVLTNARHGGTITREILDWAFDAYLGVSEPAPEPLALTGEQLATFAGTYAGFRSTLEVAVEGDRLLASQSSGADLYAAVTKHDARPATPPLPLKVLPDDRLLILDGSRRGARGAVLRDEYGAIQAIDLGGRILKRVSGP
jgi:CubicO group peptidase (beta-lactamase class C family)